MKKYLILLSLLFTAIAYGDPFEYPLATQTTVATNDWVRVINNSGTSGNISFANFITSLTSNGVVGTGVNNTFTQTNNFTGTLQLGGTNATRAMIGDASGLSTGTVADARLSTNIPLENAANTFTASGNAFSLGLGVTGTFSLTGTHTGPGYTFNTTGANQNIKFFTSGTGIVLMSSTTGGTNTLWPLFGTGINASVDIEAYNFEHGLMVHTYGSSGGAGAVIFSQSGAAAMKNYQNTYYTSPVTFIGRSTENTDTTAEPNTTQPVLAVGQSSLMANEPLAKFYSINTTTIAETASLFINADASVVTTGSISTAGGIGLKTTGSNAGTVILASGNGTITSNAITATSVIILTMKTSSGTPAPWLPKPTVSTGSATVTGTSTDNSTYNWAVIKQY